MRIAFAYKGRYWVREARTLELLAAQARAAGHQPVLAYDPDLFGVSDNVLSLPWLNRLLFAPDLAARRALALNPSWVVVLETISNGAWVDAFLAALGRLGYKGRTAVIACGGHFSADCCLYGEPEKVFPDLLKAMPHPPASIKAEGLADLEALPFPDHSLFAGYENFRASYMAYAGRGCSGNCSYCEEPFYRGLYGGVYGRRRTPARVIAELREVKERFRNREITFKDPVLTSDKAWLKDFLAVYRREIGLPFKCFGRPDAFDPETAAMLKAAGCYCVEFGLQTFNERIRGGVLRRPESLAAVEKAFAACDAAGLAYDADYIFGLPGETIADHKEAALRFAGFRRLNRIKCHNLVYYKGLPVRDAALKGGLSAADVGAGGDFFSGDRAAPAMRGPDAAFRNLFKLYGLIGAPGLRFAAVTGLWRLLRFVPGLFVKPLELTGGLLRRDRRFLVYLRRYPSIAR